MVKLGLALLALLRVHPAGQRWPRRLLWTAGWVSAVGLVLYGGLQMLGVFLAGTGLVPTESPMPADVFWWRLLLWEPWFLIWGTALMVTLWPAESGAGRLGSKLKNPTSST